jgi:hypothetical protein
MFDLPPVAEGNAADFDEIVEAAKPVVLRGLVSDWPAVASAASSPEHLCAYLSRFDSGAPVAAYIAPPAVGGRFFYSEDLQGFNFERPFMPLGKAAELMASEVRKGSRNSVYVGSAHIKQALPGFERENALPLLDRTDADPRIWLGTPTTVAAHFDAFNNIACVVAGRRRFTLFPPDQVSNLYVGPLDNTVSGAPTTMVDLRNPDFERFPRFRQALAAARVAELEPGDAIFVPALWWHHVEALSPLNMLVNYWWNDGPSDAGPALACIGHGLLTISHLPLAQRKAWREMFDYYVFRLHGDPAEHIPSHARGVLSKTSLPLRQSIKEFLIRTLSMR